MSSPASHSEKPTVSVSVVTCNSGDETLQTLETLFTNSEKYAMSVYVIDNASTDGYPAIIQTRFPQVQLICNTTNTGFGAAHNVVLDRIESDYHLVLNPDIAFEEDSIGAIVDYLEEHPNVVMATPRILNQDHSEQTLPKRLPCIRYLFARRLGGSHSGARHLQEEYTRADETFDEPTSIEACTGCFFIIRTDAFKRLNGFDERFFLYFEDVDITLRASDLGDVMFFPHTAVVHSWHRSSTKSKRLLCIHIASMVRFFNKWGWRI